MTDSVITQTLITTSDLSMSSTTSKHTLTVHHALISDLGSPWTRTSWAWLVLHACCGGAQLLAAGVPRSHPQQQAAPLACHWLASRHDTQGSRMRHRVLACLELLARRRNACTGGTPMQAGHRVQLSCALSHQRHQLLGHAQRHRCVVLQVQRCVLMCQHPLYSLLCSRLVQYPATYRRLALVVD
jgi:hypothetical protein